MQEIVTQNCHAIVIVEQIACVNEPLNSPEQQSDTKTIKIRKTRVNN